MTVPDVRRRLPRDRYLRYNSQGGMTRLWARRQARARRPQLVYNVVVTVGFVVMLSLAAFWFLQARVQSHLANAGVAVPSPSAGAATPLPATRSPRPDDEPTEKILYDLQQRVVKGAGVVAATTGRCDRQITGLRNEEATCTITYDGLKVTYAVNVTGGSPYFTWRATTEWGVLTRAGVYRAFWQQYGHAGRDLRCDAAIPDKQLQPLGRVTGYSCYYTDNDSGHSHQVAVRLTDGHVEFVHVGSDVRQ